MIKADLYGALSRGYCTEKNKHKIIDSDLIEAMADEILLLYCSNQGSLEKKAPNIHDKAYYGSGHTGPCPVGCQCDVAKAMRADVKCKCED
jgi:hypothetical protein